MRDFKVFGRDVLNIFCDASIKKTTLGTYGCPGSIAVDTTGSSVDYESTILVDSTNNESEIYAILLATRQAIKYKDRFARINIFSDSRISVCGMRDWMLNWIRRANGDTLMSTSGVVANQQLFLQVLTLIMNNLDSYRLFHVDGHMNPNNPKHIFTFMRDFEKFNGIKIGPLEAQYLCTYNNLIDKETGDDLEKVDLDSLMKLDQPFVYPVPPLLEAQKLYKDVFE